MGVYGSPELGVFNENNKKPNTEHSFGLGDFIIGFRSRKPCKMIIAVLFYLLCIYSYIIVTVDILSLMFMISIPYIICGGLSVIAKKSKKDLILFIVGFAFLISSVALMTIKYNSQQAFNQAKNTEERIWVTIDTLCNDFRTNELQAEEYYKQQPIYITGIVDSVEKSIWGEYSVRFKCQDAFINPICYFSDKSFLSELRAGYEVTLYGEMSDFTMDSPTMRNCKMVEYYQSEHYINNSEINTITLKEYNSLRTGTNYRQCVKTIGGEGELILESSYGDYKIEMYSWKGNGDIGANAVITFEDGKLSAKSQIGLK